MQKYLTLEKDYHMKVSSNITEYLSPQELYLPINKKAILLKKNRKVKKGEALYTLEEKTYYSPVSGSIQNIVKRNSITHKDELYLHIINDYHEEDNYQGLNELTTVRLELDFMHKMKDYPDSFWNRYRHKKELILNGMEDSLYNANKMFWHLQKTSEILEMLDLLGTTFNIPMIKIYLKETDEESIEAFHNFLETYPNISLNILPDVYPLMNEQALQNYLKIGEETAVISTEETLNLYQNVVKNRKKDKILLTITGTMVKNPQVIRAKIGTPLKEIVASCIEFKNGPYELIVNSLMNGPRGNLNDVIVGENVNCFYFMKPVSRKEKDCIHCGKCVECCPLNCNPYLYHQTKDPKYVKSCISCNVCSYLCPSNISLGLSSNPSYLHQAEKNKSHLYVLILLLLMMFYGMYKNGFAYFLQGEYNFLQGIYGLIFFLISIGMMCFFQVIRKKKITLIQFNEALLLGLMIPPRFPVLPYFAILILYYGIELKITKYSVSKVLLFKVITILYSILIGLNYQNQMEVTYPYFYGIIDQFFGLSVGGFGITSIFLILFLYFVLNTDSYYKRELPLFALGTFSCLILIYDILMKESNMISYLLTSSVFFMSIVLAPLNPYSPALKQSLMIYGLVLGLISFCCVQIFKNSDYIYFGLLLLQLINIKWSKCQNCVNKS